MAMNPRLLVPRATFDPDAARYLAAVEAADGQALETPVRRAVDAFVKELKADSLWDAIGTSCLLCGPRTLEGALVPLRGDAPTAQGGWASGDYDRATGLTGDPTASLYLDSNRANDADPQDSKHLAVYATTATSAGQVYAGSSFDTSLYRAFGADFSARVNRSTLFTVVTGAAASTGLLAANRPAFGTTETRAGGTTVTESRDANTHISENTAIFARLSSGVASLYSDATLAFYSVGSSIDLTKLDTHITAYVTAIGAAL